MPIISLSITDQLAQDIARFTEKTDSGKSEFARAAITKYLDSHYQTIIEPARHYTLTLSIVCAEKHKHEVHEVLHELDVRSQFHLCLHNGRCIETFGVQTNGKDLLIALAAIESVPKVEKIQLCLG